MDNKSEVGRSLGIVRKNLPQIVSSEVRNFVQYLEDNGVTVSAKKRKCSELMPSQLHLNKDKIKQMASNPDCLNRPVFTSNDPYLLDGHHRWAGNLLNNPNSLVKCIEASCSIDRLIELGQSFKGAKFKSIHESATQRTFLDCLSVFV